MRNRALFAAFHVIAIIGILLIGWSCALLLLFVPFTNAEAGAFVWSLILGCFFGCLGTQGMLRTTISSVNERRIP